MDASVPKKLYKYRKFDLFVLKMLTNGTVFFSDPRNFNDPLDCKPEILVDFDLDSLEELCMRMTEGSSKILHDCKLAAACYDGEAIHKETYLKDLLRDRIKEVLYSNLNMKGVFSLAESWSCPLMWSHYGDQHNGICLGYETTLSPHELMKKVDYEGTRCIKCSDLLNMYKGCNTAKERIHHAFLFTKAKDWKYEREWRLVSETSGEESSPFKLSEIYFGMRSDHAAKTTILNLMSCFNIDFFEVNPRSDSFDLQATLLDTEAKQRFRALPSLRVIFARPPELPIDKALPCDCMTACETHE